MTPNEKRAADVVQPTTLYGNEAGALIRTIAAHLDAAERRGEDRVLRWLDQPGVASREVRLYREYRKARRRARGSR